MKAKCIMALLVCAMLFTLTACDDDSGDVIACNDPNAVSWDARATSNLQCSYPAVFNPPEAPVVLPVALKEISGLAAFGDVLIGHNDRSNQPRLFFFAPNNGLIQATMDVLDAPNNDWEDLAISDTHLYIGDIGNNEGDRTDLGIFRVPLAAILPGQVTQVSADAHIRFRYPEQQRFDVPEHNFDCEALIYFEGFLYMFTKHRADRRTNLYRIPAIPGQVHDAELLGGFNAEGRIGGADISADGSTVALVGYRRTTNSFVWKLYDFQDPRNFLSGKKRLHILGPYSQIGQIEGVQFKSETELYISSEEEPDLGLPPKLYVLTNF